MTLLAVAIDGEAAAYLLAGIHNAQDEARRNGYRPIDSLAALEQTLKAALGTTSDQYRPDQTGKQTVDLGAVQAGIDERKFYSRAEVAEMSGKNERQVYYLIAHDKLPETALGIPRAAIERLGLDHMKPRTQGEAP